MAFRNTSGGELFFGAREEREKERLSGGDLGGRRETKRKDGGRDVGKVFWFSGRAGKEFAKRGDNSLSNNVSADFITLGEALVKEREKKEGNLDFTFGFWEKRSGGIAS